MPVFENKRKITLAIETAIGGGSLSLLEENAEIDFWIGSQEISKAEDLLENISQLISRNNLRKSDIKKIVYSKGPGSYTGIRIGSATVKGLKRALRCDCLEISVLQALTVKAKNEDKVRTMVQTGENEIWTQTFENGNIESVENAKFVTEQKKISSKDFFNEFESNANDSIFTVAILKKETALELLDNISKTRKSLPDRFLLLREPENIARLLGLAAGAL